MRPASGRSSGPTRGRSSAATRSSRAEPRGRRRAASGRCSSATTTFQPLYGGEAVRIDGEIVGRLRSVAFGHTVQRTVGTVYLDAGIPEATAIEADLFDTRVSGEVAPDVLVDPTGARLRA